MTPFFIYVYLSTFLTSKKQSLREIAKKYELLFYIVTFLNIITFLLYINGKIVFLIVSNVYYSLCLYSLTLVNKKLNKISTILMFNVLLLSNKRAGLLKQLKIRDIDRNMMNM